MSATIVLPFSWMPFQKTRRFSTYAVPLFLLLSMTCLSGNSVATELGANKFDLMMQFLPIQPSASEQIRGIQFVRKAMARKAIADARDAGLSFLRVAISGYAPARHGDTANDLAEWQSDPQKFWLTLDEMFDELDAANVKLVPSFVWNLTQFPILSGDTVTEFLRNSESRSRRLLAQYIRDFVNRYSKRNTILFYELTNEMNLAADLDQEKRYCTNIPAEACVLTNFTTADMVAFSRNLVSLVKSLDPLRQVASGYSLPRVAATHLMSNPEFSKNGADWKADTKEEFTRYLIKVNEPFDIISIHVYADPQANRFRRPDGLQFQMIGDAAEAANSVNKPLFVGEFGDSGVTPFITGSLDELVRNHVAYAAIWVWEFYQKATYLTHDTDADRFSIEPGYDNGIIGSLIETERASGAVAPARTPNQLPRVVLTWPLPCSTISKKTDLMAVASDGAGAVERVIFFVGGTRVAETNTAPYRVQFDPTEFGRRTIPIEARAVKASGVSASFTIPVRLNSDQLACEIPRN